MDIQPITANKQLQRYAKSLMLMLLILELQGCVSHRTVGFDEWPDGNPVPSWDGSDLKVAGISTQYADATSWGYRKGLELNPPNAAAFLPRSSQDALSPPNELCLIRFEDSQGEPGFVLFREEGVRRAWISITSGEATVTTMSPSGQEIESRAVGLGRHEFSGKVWSMTRNGIGSLSISDPVGANDPFCFDDVEWEVIRFM